MQPTQRQIPIPSVAIGGIGTSNAPIDVAEGGDLSEELTKALGGKFDFKGNFYHISKQGAEVPNPFLSIEGLGAVGIPLSERDAQAIIHSAPRVAVPGTNVASGIWQNAGELQPAKVQVRNAKWTKWLEEKVVTEVLKGLGITQWNMKPRLELVKLSVHGRGTHPAKIDGTFSTVVIILPSAYEGGLPWISHSGMIKIVNGVCASSATEFHLLTWYSEVKHAFTQVTSGYRVAKFKQVLQKWQLKKYGTKGTPSPPYFCYVLRELRNDTALARGLVCLSGGDAGPAGIKVSLHGHKRIHLYDVYGISDDEDEDRSPEMERYGRTMQYKLGTLVDMAGKPILEEGGGISNEDSEDEDSEASRETSGKHIVPADAFEGAPDEKQCDYHEGRYTYSQTLTVLVLFYESDRLDVNFSLNGGVSWGMDKLQKSSIPPTADDRKIAEAVVSALRDSSPSDLDRMARGNGNTVSDLSLALKIMEYATNWKDLDLWNRALAKAGYSVGDEQIVNAIKSFTFTSLKPSFEEIFKYTKKLSNRMGVLKAISDNVPKKAPAIRTWIKKQTAGCLVTYEVALVEDIPCMIDIAKGAGGLKSLDKSVLPNLSGKSVKLDFWMDFAKALQENKASIPTTKTSITVDDFIHNCMNAAATTYSTAQAGSVPHLITIAKTIGLKVLDDSVIPKVISQKSTFEFWMALAKGLDDNRAHLPTDETVSVDSLAEECINAAVPQWRSGINPTHHYHYHSANSTRLEDIRAERVAPVIQIFEFCVKTKLLTPCGAVLSDVLNKGDTSKDMETKFDDTCTPLVKLLKATLAKLKQDIASPPFGTCVRNLTRILLADILGRKGTLQAAPAPLRQVNFSRPQDTGESESANASRIEVEASAYLCSFETIKAGSPHTLVVRKSAGVVAVRKWEGKVEKTKLFLAGVGNEGELKRLFGVEGYETVRKAVSGEQAFPKAVAVASTRTVESVSALKRKAADISQ
ncbi:hypothetical protein FA15DRAFT_755871 [Coprinopsis marcescibilis]|uniref:Uncharacterized protein n=1 Tax=Coprinopsis marcescibilis TaxID=230819 RepID=A0A5C3LAP9_COPMA|nr:hypothetical protein FA15DRAFT_755871 [Coprinopsis marcescibilis]